MKYNLSFLILLLAFIGLASFSEAENSFFNIDQISGVLYEKKDQQDVILVFPTTNINPSSIKQIIIKNEEKMEKYPTQITCDYKKEIHFNTYVKCSIDLTNVPSGFYKIILLIYNNKQQAINNIHPFLVLEDDSANKPLELIEVIANNITEYDDSRKIKLIFSKRIDQAHTIRRLYMVNYRNETFDVPITCDYGLSWSVIDCSGSFYRIKEGKYLVKEIYYNKPSVYPSRNIYIHVQTKVKLELVSIKGNAYRGRSVLDLKFNKVIDSDSISNFILYNETRLYNLFTPYIDQSNHNSVTVDFDFTIMSVGKYHLGLAYNGIEYNFSNIYLEIKQ